jgi:hypothetical protein
MQLVLYACESAGFYYRILSEGNMRDAQNVNAYIFRRPAVRATQLTSPKVAHYWALRKVGAFWFHLDSLAAVGRVYSLFLRVLFFYVFIIIFFLGGELNFTSSLLIHGTFLRALWGQSTRARARWPQSLQLPRERSSLSL